MKKDEELRLLEEVADRLDPDSTYCGAWLREQIPAIRLAMESDLLPDMATVSFAEASRVVEEAHLKAAEILAKAQKAADAKREAVNASLADQVDRVAYALNAAAETLRGFS